MAALVKDGRLSKGVLGMRFMQRKAEQELAEQLSAGGESDTQWRGAGRIQRRPGAQAGPTIVYEGRKGGAGAARSYSRRSFGSFAPHVEAAEQAELAADQAGAAPPSAAAAEAGAATSAGAAKASTQERGRAERGRSEPAQAQPERRRPEQPQQFRQPANDGPAESGQRGDWRGKLEQKRRRADASGDAGFEHLPPDASPDASPARGAGGAAVEAAQGPAAAAGRDLSESVVVSGKKKKKRKKKRKLSAKGAAAQPD